ncbi:MAG: hypothetical protein J7L72_01275 [Candidatus Aminicenantes bacterium]|nr:hypothetical protein [Candidatus Aminicenantes bacterium]
MIDLPAPEFELKDLDGETISLMSLKGKVVLLNTENNVIDSYKVSGIPTKFSGKGQLSPFRSSEVFYIFFAEDHHLYVRVHKNPQRKLMALEKDVFSFRGKFTFKRDNDGQINSFVLDAGRVTNLKFIKQE